jgi:hypothetical protein
MTVHVHVFKPSNEHAGNFSVASVAEVPTQLAEWVRSHAADLPLYSYAEANSKIWTITSIQPVKLEDGRVQGRVDVASRSDGYPGPAARSGSVVVNRYRDAYRVGAALVGLGHGIKVVGAVLAGIIFLGSLTATDGPFGGGAVVAGIFMAALVGALFWVCAVVVAAQGQILRATLDNAVGGSPFLSDGERLDAMGLRGSVAERAVPQVPHAAAACPQCGGDITATQRFCRSCGAALQSA